MPTARLLARPLGIAVLLGACTPHDPLGELAMGVEVWQHGQSADGSRVDGQEVEVFLDGAPYALRFSGERLRFIASFDASLLDLHVPLDSGQFDATDPRSATFLGPRQVARYGDGRPTYLSEEGEEVLDTGFKVNTLFAGFGARAMEERPGWTEAVIDQILGSWGAVPLDDLTTHLLVWVDEDQDNRDAPHELFRLTIHHDSSVL